jgi:selenocysteine-specific elongation factor
VQVHDVDVEHADAGQRVAVNLAGVRAREVGRGDVLAHPGTRAERLVLDCALTLRDARHGERVHVHHGTREAPARLSALGDDLYQLRLEAPLIAADGDRVVVRRLSPPDTLGGGVVLDAAARRHGRRPDVLERLAARRDGREVAPAVEADAAPARGAVADAAPTPSPALRAAADALAARLRDVGLGLLSEAQIGDREALALLRAEGRAVRVSGTLYADAALAAGVCGRIVAMIEDAGSTSLAEVRDALATSRKPAQAFLEHLDATRVTRRRSDDRRVLR